MKNAKFMIFFLVVLPFFWGCSSNASSKVNQPLLGSSENPPAPGFDLTNSDQKAIKIADKVMEAMGGRKYYDNTRYLFWNFFGSRTLLWDKKVGNVRIESEKDDYTLVMNIHSMEGKVKMKGEELTNPDSLSKYLQMGKDIWINDSYWLVMPFKLKDSGVTLTYVGEEEFEGKANDVLELKFKNVGKTPQNKYQVYVDQSTNLVSQWSFFPKADDAEPRFKTPWTDYVKHGEILLSGGRGKYELTEIKVMDKVGDAMFERLD